MTFSGECYEDYSLSVGSVRRQTSGCPATEIIAEVAIS